MWHGVEVPDSGARTKTRVGLSLMPTDDFARASYPLFEAGLVDTLEWSFDMAWRSTKVPEWVLDLLSFYSSSNALVGHGVSYSVVSARWSGWQDEYLNRLQEEFSNRAYVRLSEHFGYCRSNAFKHNTILPVPPSAAALQCGVRNLQRLADAASVQVGLENLAFAYSREEALTQGRFIDLLLRPVNGYVVVDLHNLWCQVCNFNIDIEHLLASFPVARVKEVHLSGGSWSSHPYGPGRIRRDTHDDAVPAEVLQLLSRALQRFPLIDTVILERLGGTLEDAAACEQFRQDFMSVQDIVSTREAPRSLFLEESSESLIENGSVFEGLIADDTLDSLAELQDRMMDVLYEAGTEYDVQQKLLSQRSLEPYRSYVRSFQPEMIHTARLLVSRWAELVER